MRTIWLKILGVSAPLLLLGAGCVSFGGATARGPVGVFRSLDKGDNWAASAAYPTAGGVKSIAGVNVYRLFNDPSDANALYLATRGQGLFYSYDRGDSWRWSEPLSGKFIYALAVDPADKCNVYVSDGAHIFKTSDCLRTWRLVYNEERPLERLVSLAVDFGNSNRVYGALIGGDILVSTNAGGSWQAVKRFGFSVQYLTADPHVAGRVYVASANNGLFRSDDAGASWVDLHKNLENFSQASQFYRLVLHPSKKNALWWVAKYGILRSDNAGVNWEELKLITPPGSVNIYAFAVSPKNDQELYYVGTIFGENNQPVRSTFYRSLDGGVNWVTKKLPTSAVPVSLFTHPEDPNLLFLGFTSVF